MTLALDRDAGLALAAAACAAAAIALLAADPTPTSQRPFAQTEPVASVTAASQPLRLRPADELGWRNVTAGARVHERDALFVPPATDARLTFRDGTTLELDERSLVVIEAPPRGRKTVALRQGSFAGVAGNDGMLVSTPQGTAQVAQGGALQVAVNEGKVQLEVTRGQATVAMGGQQKTLQGGQRGELSSAGFAEVSPWPVKLEAPTRGQRRFFRGAPPPVEFAWAGALPEGAALEVARDRGFAFVIQQQPAAAPRPTFSAVEPGVYWWRVVDAAREPLSEARRFSLLEDVPPAPISPRAGQVVLAAPGRELEFVWSEVRGVTRYRLEISASPDFSRLEAERVVERPQVRDVFGLAEATWYWRVRASDEDRGDSGSSEPIAFRLIHKDILDAPELLAPEIEVTPEGQRKK